MAKKQGQELVQWEEELARAARETAKGENLPTAKFISMRGGRLSFGGAEIPGNELRAIVVGSVHENQYYDTDYDPEATSIPACYAFGTDEETMEPHEAAQNKQSEVCKGCPHNEWGSAERGQGKACKNVRRLALVSEDALEEGDIAGAEVAYLKVPVTSTKNWAVYVKKTLQEVIKRPYWAVITKISVVPDPKSQFKVQFEFEEAIEDKNALPKLRDKSVEVMKKIDFPYVIVERKEPVKKQLNKKRKF